MSSRKKCSIQRILKHVIPCVLQLLLYQCPALVGGSMDASSRDPGQLLMDCYNNAEDGSEPSNFSWFMEERPARLVLKRFWWSSKQRRHLAGDSNTTTTTSDPTSSSSGSSYASSPHGAASLGGGRAAAASSPQHRRRRRQPTAAAVAAAAAPLRLTLFTMASMDRLPLLEAQCRSYPGPLSAAVYLPLLVERGGSRSRKSEAEAAEERAAGSGRGTTGAQGVEGDDDEEERPELRDAVQQLQALFSRLEAEPRSCGLLLGLYVEATADPAMAALMPTNALRNAALLAAGAGAGSGGGAVGVGDGGGRGGSGGGGSSGGSGEDSGDSSGDAAPLVAMVDVDLSASAGLARLVADERRLSALLHRARRERALLVLPAWEPDRGLGLELGGQLAQLALAGDKQLLRRMWLGGPLSNATGSATTGSQSPSSQSEAGASAAGRCPPTAAAAAANTTITAQQALAAGCPDLLVPFDVKSFAAGHRATDFARALAAARGDDYRVAYEDGFEPWFIAARDQMLPYDERFRGWYGDKITQVRTMAAARRAFWVAADAWLVHRPHPPAAARALFRNEGSRSNVTLQGVAALEQVIRPRLLRRTKFEAYVTHSKNMDYWQRRALVLRGGTRWEPKLSAATRRCWQQLPWWRRPQQQQ